MAVTRRGDLDGLQTRLSDRAWELCQEALEYGSMHLKNGKGESVKIVQLEDKDIVRHAQWLAGLSAKKKPRTSMPAIKDDYTLPETK